MSLEPQEKKGVVSFFANLPLIRRIKIIKELSLEKLDQILDKSNNLEIKTNSLLNNDTSFLEANILVIQTLKSIYKQSQNYYNNLLTIVQEVSKKLSFLLQNNESQNTKLNTLEEKINTVDENLSIVNEEITNIKTLSEKTLSEQNHLKQLYDNSLSQQNVIKQLYHDSLSQQNVIKQLCENFLQQQQSLFQQQQKITNIVTDLTPKPLIINDSSKELNEPEIGLMMYLYSFLPNRYAIDVGANIGDVSESLLKAGYEVYAFEPFLPTYEKLKLRLEKNPNFHCHQIALGSNNDTKELYLATDKTPDKIYQDSSLYNSLIKHSMPEDLSFTDSTTVTVKTLASLHDSREIPSNVGLVKIDTEGFDLQVIQGMGLYQYPVVITEFWDSQIPFGISETHNKLENLVTEMRRRKYYWHIVMYRVWGDKNTSIAFYCNHSHSVTNSWGNIFFFQDYNIFVQAHRWALSVISETYFY
ncbi:FkbM family methyltransferase [Geminocystis sp. NIES-3709]|uniref:FkbM family methyltransferase n=1 Tax=Geminocystis sp. NIES-3709 TaxID=1617448 RepID=UPI0005FC8A84|nr:FkbM family methyltransferase [Geminocystis sp. NIES-3709]BAQ66226.1 hypothetical protein GM3709_2991 [Geminocystis sp. NIES-3709]